MLTDHRMGDKGDKGTQYLSPPILVAQAPRRTWLLPFKKPLQLPLQYFDEGCAAERSTGTAVAAGLFRFHIA